MTPIELEVWEPMPDKPGCSHRVCNVPLGHVYDQLVERLQTLDDSGWFEGVCPVYQWFTANPACWRTHQWPTWGRWIACYAVTGDNEGHYVHVDVIDQDRERTPIFQIKTFGGLEHALKLTGWCTELLGA